MWIICFYSISYFLNAFFTIFQVTFPETVKWMALEFDPACGTAQNEDVLQLLIPSRLGSVVTACPQPTNRNEEAKTSQKFCSVFKKFSGSDNWPKQAVILPGKKKQPSGDI